MLTKVLIAAVIVLPFLIAAYWYFRVRPGQQKKKSDSDRRIAGSISGNELVCLSRLARATTNKPIELHVFELLLTGVADPAAVAKSMLAALVSKGCATSTKNGYRVTPFGREVHQLLSPTKRPSR